MTNHRQSASPLSSLLLLLAASLLLLVRDVAAVRTYTDAKGDTFTIPDDKKAKIVTNVIGALSLFHLGLESEQLVAIYDHWAVRGSTIDFDDPTQEYDSEFAVDPNKEEVAFLEGAVNLSPPEKCRDASGGCWNDIGEDEIASLGEDSYDFIVLLRTGNGSSPGIEAATGQKIIFVDYKYDHNVGCYGTGDEKDTITNEEDCWSMSLIDAVIELEKFAAFLGIAPTAKVAAEKRDMCRAAEEFVEHAKTLHDKGIYAQAVSFRPFNGLTINWFSPITFPWLRTLEELGFPIVHPPNDPSMVNGVWQSSAEDWFVNCDTYPNCMDVTGKRPVDLWLLDSRTYGTVHNFQEDSIGEFPDRAFAKRQYTYWQFNDGAISYTNIARYLDDVRSQTMNLERVHTETLQCVDVDVTSRAFSNKLTGGIQTNDPAGGTFACHGNLQSLYTECPAPEEEVAIPMPEDEPEPSADMSAGVRCVATATTALVAPLVVAWMYTN